MPEYEFFVSSGAPKPATKAMRSHAMRTALQLRQDSTEASAASVGSRRTEEQKEDLTSRFKVEGTPKRRRRRRKGGSWPALDDGGDADASTQRHPALVPIASKLQVRPVQRFGSSQVDPFGQIPVPQNPKVDLLVKYFLTQFTLNISTADRQRPWFGYAMEEPIIMHATLALAAAFWATSSPGSQHLVRAQGIYHQGEVMKEVTRMLHEEGAISDTLIAAVATLGNVAANDGRFEEADAHIRAVHRLVNIRGGAMQLKDNFLAARAVNWVDVLVAAGLGRGPLMPLIHGIDEVDIPDALITESEAPDLAHLDRIGYGADTIRSVLMFLRQAVLARRYRIAVPNGIRIILNVAEISILKQLELQPQTPEEHRFKTLLLAAHVFLHAELRKLPRRGRLVRNLLDRLREALSAGEINTLAWEQHMSALFWIVFTGTVAAEGDTEGDRAGWFADRLDVMAQLLRCDSVDLVQKRLEKFIWADEFGRRFLNTWWSTKLPPSLSRAQDRPLGPSI